MTNNQSIDYGIILADLKAKRSELDKVIKNLEGLADLGLLNHATDPRITSHTAASDDSDLSRLGTYEGTAALLKRKGRTMKTNEAYQELINNGVVSKETKLATVAATLYKSLKTKKDAKIKLAGRGEWALKEWH